MARFVDPLKILNLIAKGKSYLIAKHYIRVVNDEYSIDTYYNNKQLSEYIRILIKSLIYEFDIDDSSELTYNLYFKLLQILDNDYLSNFTIYSSISGGTDNNTSGLPSINPGGGDNGDPNADDGVPTIDPNIQYSNSNNYYNTTVINNNSSKSNRFRIIYLVDDSDNINAILTTDAITGAFQVKSNSNQILYESASESTNGGVITNPELLAYVVAGYVQEGYVQ